MKECVLCGHKMANDEIRYSYDKYLHEADKGCHPYCRECKEILRSSKAASIGSKKRIRKVKIKTSDYHLPGFVPSEDGKHFVRIKSKRGEKRCGGVGKIRRK